MKLLDKFAKQFKKKNIYNAKNDYLEEIDSALNIVEESVNKLKVIVENLYSYEYRFPVVLNSLENDIAILNKDRLKYANKCFLERLIEKYDVHDEENIHAAIKNIINTNNLMEFDNTMNNNTMNDNKKIIYDEYYNEYYQIRLIRCKDKLGNEFYIYMSTNISSQQRFFRACEYLRNLIDQQKSSDVIIAELKSVLELQQKEFNRRG